MNRPLAAVHPDDPARPRLALLGGQPDSDGERTAAVIDLGSNSWRFVAFRYSSRGAWRRVAQLQEPVRIAHGLAAAGRLDADRVAIGLDTIELFADHARGLGVAPPDVEVVATSALRDAADGPEFLTRAAAMTGLAIRTLTAEEEARYGYLAAVNSTTLTDGLTLDLGGGSLQLVSVRGREALGFHSWPLGAVRVTEEMLPGDRPASRKQLKRARAALRERLADVERLPAEARRIVGMGGAVRNLAAAAMRARRSPLTSVQGSVLRRTELRELIGALARRAPHDRALAGIKPARADVILGAALVLDETLALAGAEALEVTRAGLREGIFFARRLLAGAAPLVPDVRVAAIRNLATLHAVDLGQAERAAELALGLYESLADAAIVQPTNEERRLLWSAAMLHKVGMSIDHDGHPTHARYIVLNSELPGHGPREVALLAQIVRYQRKGAPGLDDLAPLARPRDLELVARCAAILRLATQLASGGARSIAARIVPAGKDLRLEVHGDDRLARRERARDSSDDTFKRAFGRRILPPV